MRQEDNNNVKDWQKLSIQQSINLFTLNFKNNELQQQYEVSFTLKRLHNLTKVYIFMSGIAGIGIGTILLSKKDDNNHLFLVLMISLSAAFSILSAMIHYFQKFFRFWNTLGVFSLNLSVIFMQKMVSQNIDYSNFTGISFTSFFMIFILMRFNGSFLVNFINILISYLTIFSILSISFLGYSCASLLIFIYSQYQSEFFSKSAFWTDLFNEQQSAIIENVVTSSLFYIRYNKKEERLEYQRGNKKFCSKFQVKDDESLRYFLKNTKIKDNLIQNHSTHNLQNDDEGNHWKNSLDNLIHKKIAEEATDQINLSNNKDKSLNDFNKLLKSKASSFSLHPIIINSPQNNLSTFKKISRKRAYSSQQRKTPLANEVERTNIELKNSASFEASQMYSSQNQLKTKKLHLDNKMDIQNQYENQQIEEQDKFKSFIKSHSNSSKYLSNLQSKPKPKQSSDLPYLLNSQQVPLPKKLKNDVSVYNAKFTPLSGEKIQFLVRILIFHMSDTFLAISIEKEDELEKYRKVKDQLQFFQSAFTQLMSIGKQKQNQELSTIRKMIPIAISLENGSTQQNQKPSQTSTYNSLISFSAENLNLKNIKKRNNFRNLTLPFTTNFTNRIDANTKNEEFMKTSQVGIQQEQIGNQQFIGNENSLVNGGQPNIITQIGGIVNNFNLTYHLNSFSTYHNSRIDSTSTNPHTNMNPIETSFSNQKGEQGEKKNNQVSFNHIYQDSKMNSPKKAASPTNNPFTFPLFSLSPTIFHHTDRSIAHISNESPNPITPSNYTLFQKKGSLMKILNKLLYSIYSRWFYISNYSYFLDFFRSSCSKIEIQNQISITSVFESIISMFNQESRTKKIKVFVHYYDKELKINTDINFLKQVFFNLFQNAFKNTPSGGYVAIRVERDKNYLDSITIKIRNQIKNNRALPTCDDCKFKIENMNEYFSKRGKINLGLRVSQRIVKQLGPTDKLILKTESPDNFQVDFSIYTDISVLGRKSILVQPPFIQLNSDEKSLEKKNPLINSVSNGSEAQFDFMKKSLFIFKSQKYQNKKILNLEGENSDNSFDNQIEKEFYQSQTNSERHPISADRYKHLQIQK